MNNDEKAFLWTLCQLRYHTMRSETSYRSGKVIYPAKAGWASASDVIEKHQAEIVDTIKKHILDAL